MRSWPDRSSRSRLTRGSMRMTSRISRLKLGAASSTAVPNEVPGPVDSWLIRARAPVTTIVAVVSSVDTADRAKVSWVAPCSVVLTSLTVWPWKLLAIAVTV